MLWCLHTFNVGHRWGPISGKAVLRKRSTAVWSSCCLWVPLKTATARTVPSEKKVWWIQWPNGCVGLLHCQPPVLGAVDWTKSWKTAQLDERWWKCPGPEVEHPPACGGVLVAAGCLYAPQNEARDSWDMSRQWCGMSCKIRCNRKCALLYIYIANQTQKNASWMRVFSRWRWPDLPRLYTVPRGRLGAWLLCALKAGMMRWSPLEQADGLFLRTFFFQYTQASCDSCHFGASCFGIAKCSGKDSLQLNREEMERHLTSINVLRWKISTDCGYGWKTGHFLGWDWMGFAAFDMQPGHGMSSYHFQRGAGAGLASHFCLCRLVHGGWCFGGRETQGPSLGGDGFGLFGCAKWRPNHQTLGPRDLSITINNLQKWTGQGDHWKIILVWQNR